MRESTYIAIQVSHRQDRMWVGPEYHVYSAEAAMEFASLDDAQAYAKQYYEGDELVHITYHRVRLTIEVEKIE